MTKIIEGKDLANMQFIETEDGLLRRYERKGKFVPEIGQDYWFINLGGYIVCDNNSNSKSDKWRIKHNLVFETIEEAEEYRRYLIALGKYSYDFNNKEWEESEYIDKYTICFDFTNKTIDINHWNNRKHCAIYFKSIKDIKSFINEVGKETIERYMFGYYR